MKVQIGTSRGVRRVRRWSGWSKDTYNNPRVQVEQNLLGERYASLQSDRDVMDFEGWNTVFLLDTIDRRVNSPTEVSHFPLEFPPLALVDYRNGLQNLTNGGLRSCSKRLTEGLLDCCLQLFSRQELILVVPGEFMEENVNFLVIRTVQQRSSSTYVVLTSFSSPMKPRVPIPRLSSRWLHGRGHNVRKTQSALPRSNVRLADLSCHFLSLLFRAAVWFLHNF